MAREKFVVRLLDPDNRLMAWTTVYGEPRPNGRRLSCCYFPVTPTRLVVEQDGVVDRVSIHWCDLDIGRIGGVLGAPVEVKKGMILDYQWTEPIFQVVGSQQFADTELPCITVRENVTISPPTGTLSAVGQ